MIIQNPIKFRLNSKNFPKNFINLLSNAGKKNGVKSIAIVGGVIRDQLIQQIFGQASQALNDIDIIIEGSALDFVKVLEDEISNKRLKIIRLNHSFNTVELKLDGIKIDIAGARLENYLSPGQNPIITNSTLEEDLKRRDFPINAIAYDISKRSLLDFYDGINDIKKRQLRFLHENSVLDDPTRIIRGARYAARLNFNLDSPSISQIKEAILQWPWKYDPEGSVLSVPSGLGTRLRMELDILFKEEHYLEALEVLQEWGGLLLLDKEIQGDKSFKKRIRWASRLKTKPLIALIAKSSNSYNIASRLQLAKGEKDLLIEKDTLVKSMNALHISGKYLNWSPSQWTKWIEKMQLRQETIAIGICIKVPLWKALLRWLNRWQHIQSPISAKDLISQGWEAGPQIKEELNRLRFKKLDQEKYFKA